LAPENVWAGLIVPWAVPENSAEVVGTPELLTLPEFTGDPEIVWAPEEVSENCAEFENVFTPEIV
jgi:hypothetical protein